MAKKRDGWLTRGRVAKQSGKEEEWGAKKTDGVLKEMSD